FLASRVAPVDHLAYALAKWRTGCTEHPAEHGQGAFENRQRSLDEGCPQGTADHDERRRAIDQRADMTTLQVVATYDGDQRQQQPDDTEDIHQPSSVR